MNAPMHYHCHANYYDFGALRPKHLQYKAKTKSYKVHDPADWGELLDVGLQIVKYSIQKQVLAKY